MLSPPSAAWHSVPTIFRQVSPESLPIFERITELYRWCCGEWSRFYDLVRQDDVREFVAYAATFLSNMGN
jgi:hypothetical protein